MTVGFFDRLFSGRPAQPPAPPEPEPPPDAVIVLREGMTLPDDDYVRQLAAPLFPEGKVPEGLPVAGVAQPRWFKPGEFTDTGVADAAAAYSRKLGVEGASHRHKQLAGPDGARVMRIELRRSR